MKRLVALLLFLPFFASAHTSGLLLEKTVGNYFIDVGIIPHDITGSLYAKDTIYFEFKLYTADKNSSVDFDKLNVTLSESGTEVFNRLLEIKGTFYMNYNFEKGGEYTLSLSYIKGDTVLVSTDFPISVGEVQTTWQKILSISWQALPIIIGWPLVTYYGIKEWRRKKQEKQKQP